MRRGLFNHVQQKVLRYWLNKRQPVAEHATLQQGTIYILPSRFGWWFVLLTTLLYLLGTNYQNNLILLLSYLLLSIFLTVMVLAFTNLYRLTLAAVCDAECFAGDQASTVAVQLSTKCASMLQIGLKGQRQSQLVMSLRQHAVIKVSLPELTRGCYPLPRLVVSSVYPLGLFTAWSYPALQAQIWVYPALLDLANQGSVALANTAAQSTEQVPTEADNRYRPYSNQQPTVISPDAIRPYQSGDQSKRILWKKLAVNPQQPVIRDSQPDTVTRLPQHLVIPPLHGAELEKALSAACYQLHILEQQGVHYSLTTPLKQLPVSTGKAHLTRCLRELALC